MNVQAVSTVPAGEAPSSADVLIIVGADKNIQ